MDYYDQGNVEVRAARVELSKRQSTSNKFWSGISSIYIMGDGPVRSFGSMMAAMIPALYAMMNDCLELQRQLQLLIGSRVS